MVRTERNTLIVDAYNANPSSMEVALKNFAALQADHKMALLGDMLELGEDSLAEHVRIAEMASGAGFDKVCFVGQEFRKALTQLQIEDSLVFDTSSDLAQWLDKEHPAGYALLIKGSRGTRMEKVIEML